MRSPRARWRSCAEVAIEPPDGASWGADDTVLYGSGSVMWVAGTRGTPEVLIPLERPEAAHGPQMLPGDEWVLYTLRTGGAGSWGAAQIVVQSVTTGERTVLLTGRDARYVTSGHLVFGLDNVIFAVPFDTGSRTVTGGPVPLVEGVREAGSTGGAAQFSVSTDGTLVYWPGVEPEGSFSLAWVTGPGEESLRRLFYVVDANRMKWGAAQIVVQSVTTGERTVLLTGRDARYVTSGHLVFGLDNVIFAVPFDTGSRTVTGGPVPLVEGVREAGSTGGAAQFSVSTDGTLVYWPGVEPEGSFSLAWVTGPGEESLRRLFYVVDANRMMVVEVGTDPTFNWGTPTEAFGGSNYVLRGGPVRGYDVAPGGERFLVRIRRSGADGDEAFNGLIFVENWHQVLLERVPIP